MLPLHPIRSGFSSRSSVVLLNAVPELPPPELATVSFPLLSSLRSRSVRPPLAVFSRYFSQQPPLCVVMKLEPMASPSPLRPTGGQMERFHRWRVSAVAEFRRELRDDADDGNKHAQVVVFGSLHSIDR